jgi:hypothetical protein
VLTNRPPWPAPRTLAILPMCEWRNAAFIVHCDSIGSRQCGVRHRSVPWAAASPMIQGAKLVMDQSQLEQAPVLSNS